MLPKRKRSRDSDNETEEEQDKITWISDELYNDLNDKRQSGHEMLNARLAVFKLLSRPARSVPRPRGEAGRKGATGNGGHRDGFALKDVLKRESNVEPNQYAQIQNTVHRLAGRYLDIRHTWRENQGEHLVTVCTEAAKLHPCLYDYDAFWPVHDQLKRHLLSMRDKYRYVDPDLEALYDAEAAARGEVRPPPRKKRHTTKRNKQQSIYMSPYPSLPGDLSIEVDRPPMPPQQPQPQPSGHQAMGQENIDARPDHVDTAGSTSGGESRYNYLGCGPPERNNINNKSSKSAAPPSATYPLPPPPSVTTTNHHHRYHHHHQYHQPLALVHHAFHDDGHDVAPPTEGPKGIMHDKMVHVSSQPVPEMEDEETDSDSYRPRSIFDHPLLPPKKRRIKKTPVFYY